MFKFFIHDKNRGDIVPCISEHAVKQYIAREKMLDTKVRFNQYEVYEASRVTSGKLKEIT